MRKSYVIMMLLMVMTGINAFAQYSGAELRYYYKSYGNSQWVFCPMNDVDSIRFTAEDYNVYTSELECVTQEGEWGLRVYLSWGFSVEELRVCVVAGAVTEDEILASYEQGTLSGMRTISTADSIYSVDFAVGDGIYKPVAFGFDKDGQMRSHYIGDEVDVVSDFRASLLAPLMYGRSDYADEWGYGSMMHIRDLMGEEMVVNGYFAFDWYSYWQQNLYLSSQYRPSQAVWLYFDNAIQGYSEVIDMLSFPGEQGNPMVRAFLGTAIAFRAMHYLDAARMYEFLPTDAIGPVNEHGNDVGHLTYPIGYARQFEEEGVTSVRRATREEMVAYISEELNRAEELLNGVAVSDKQLANINVVRGLKARLHLWAGNYDEAQRYADMVIYESGSQILTESEWLNPIQGFNDSRVSSWLWAMRYDNPGILLNWTSWCSNQTTFGYTGTQEDMYSLISTSAYNRMADTDFRKKSFKAPAGSALSGTETYPDGIDFHRMPDLTSLKFRPGQGNVHDYTICAKVDVPLMRIEEMYFILMEALVHRGELARAVHELNAFMTNYRDPQYHFEPTVVEEVMDEIIYQKRMEFFGEGINYFDYKRLNMPVVRSYEGTNCAPEYRFNTTTRPAWMNFVFVMNAYGGKIEEWNNPDPSGCYPVQ